ncbi:hypothetical protein BHE74_00016051, partial [Ensete ventricosum]
CASKEWGFWGLRSVLEEEAEGQENRYGRSRGAAEAGRVGAASCKGSVAQCFLLHQ